MKLLLLLVLLIAAFTANCRDFPDGLLKPASAIEEQDSDVYQQQNKDVKGSIGIELRGKKDKVILTRLIAKLDSLDSKLTQANLKLNAELQSIREKQDNITDTDTELKLKLHKMMKNITDADTNIKMDLQTLKKHQDNITDSLTHNNAAILSKLNSASASDSQLKKDVFSMKQNLTNANSGILSKLNSVSTSNSQLNTDLSSMKQNLTDTNSDILSKLHSISANKGCKVHCPANESFFVPSGTNKCFKLIGTRSQITWSVARSNCAAQGLVLAKIEDADAVTIRKYILDNYGSETRDNIWIDARGNGSGFVWQQDGQQIPNNSTLWYPGQPGSSYSSSYCLTLGTETSWLQRYPNQPYYGQGCGGTEPALCEWDHQVNCTDNNRDLIDELKSAMENITDSNSQLKTDVSTMKENLTNTNSIILSKLNNISAHQGCKVHCPANESFFVPSGTNKCFKLIGTRSQITWSIAKSNCAAQGLVLAEIEDADAVTIRKYILDNYASEIRDNVWIDARGNGSGFVWQRDGQQIPNNSTLWYPGHPGTSYSSSYCLTLGTETSWLQRYPNQPYYGQGCGGTEPALCERDHQVNCTDNNRDLIDELKSVMENITDSNSQLKTDVSTMRENLTNTNSIILSKLNNISANQGCPVRCPANESFFMPNGTNQCLKLIATETSWSGAKSNCAAQGLVLAKLYDAVAVRKYIVDRYNYRDNIWIDARGNGSRFVWQRDSEPIDNNSTLWYPGHPGSSTSSYYCLTLATTSSWLNSYPNQPYIGQSCTSPTEPALCEWDHQVNCTDTTRDLIVDLKSVMENITDSSSQLKTDVSTMKENLTNTNSIILSKLNNISAHQDCKVHCPANESFFVPSGTNKCFKLIGTRSQITWSVARSNCAAQGLVLAKIEDAEAVTVRKYILDNYGSETRDNIWIDARGNGYGFVWQRDGQQIPNNSTLWYPGHPGSSYSSSYCLTLGTETSWLQRYPNQPYYGQGCGGTEPALCERTHQVNCTDTTRDLIDNLKSVMENITDSNSQLKTDVSTMKENLTNTNSIILSKLKNISAHQGCKVRCPANESFFMPNGTNQCLKLIATETSWSGAKSNCAAQGLVLAKLHDAVAVRKYIMDKYNYRDNVWIDARGDGSRFVWQRDGQHIPNNSPLWYTGQPGTSYSSSYCLSLATWSSAYTSYPNQPYYMQGCTSPTEPALCEWDHQVNCADTTRDLIDDLKSIKTMINSSNTKMDILLAHRDYPVHCPANESFFVPPGANKCFKLIGTRSQITWSVARSNCAAQGLVLAIIDDADAVTVRKYILDHYASETRDNIWIDARGNGYGYVWQRSGQQIPNNSTLWYPGQPGSSYSSSYCLTLGTEISWMQRYPNQPYYGQGCGGTEPALCELLNN